MKNNSIYTEREVPSVHPGCTLAETGAGDYDDFDNPLKSFNVIPEGKEDTVLVRTVKKYISDGEYHEDFHYELSSEIECPSDALEEQFSITVVVPSGVHPFDYLKKSGVNIANAWVFMHKEVVDNLRTLPYKHHLETVAFGEFFRFEDCDTISLQCVEHFPNWKVILVGKINEEDFYRPESPETIIEVVMK